MRSLIQTIALISFCAFSGSGVPAQSIAGANITTYVGPQLPRNGTDATTQAIDGPSAVVPDGNRGFYLVSQDQNRVYRVGADGRLSLFAGSSYGFGGDSGPATSAQLNRPAGIALDPLGNVYIADQGNNRVRKVTPTGVISTVAGTGTPGYSGDNGPAVFAQLNLPNAVVFDPITNNLYIADTFNHLIRRVTSDGIIKTVAGSPQLPGFFGDGGLAFFALLAFPRGIAVDLAGNLFITTNGSLVRKVTRQTGVISTVTGVSVPTILFEGVLSSLADGIAVDGSGNVYVVDTNYHRVVKIAANGQINRVAGVSTGPFIGDSRALAGFSGDGGPATAAQLNFPKGIAVDVFGNLYIADYGNGRIRKVSNGAIDTIAGNGLIGTEDGPANATILYGPVALAFDANDNLYVADYYNSRIRKATPDGSVTTVAGGIGFGFAGDSGPASLALLNHPAGVAIDMAGNIYITDTGNDRIRKVNTSGIISTVAGGGNISTDGVLATVAKLGAPSGIAVDAKSNLFIADTMNSKVRKVNTSGIISTVAGSDGPPGFSGDDGPAISAKLSGPMGVAVDREGIVYIADTGNNRIRKVSPTGIIRTVAGTGRSGFGGDGGRATSANLNGPEGVAVDLIGNLYIADAGNNRIRVVTWFGGIDTVAGNGVAGFSGDGGQARSAQLNYPEGVALDSRATGVRAGQGRLYIADSSNHRIRRGPIVYDPDSPLLSYVDLAVRNTQGIAGTVVQVPISLTSHLVFFLPSQFQLDLSFDANQVTFNSARRAGTLAAAGGEIAVTQLATGVLRLVGRLVDPKPNPPYIYDGDVAVLNFTLKNPAAAGGSTDLICSDALATDYTGSPHYTRCTSGRITVITPSTRRRRP